MASKKSNKKLQGKSSGKGSLDQHLKEASKSVQGWPTWKQNVLGRHVADKRKTGQKDLVTASTP